MIFFFGVSHFCARIGQWVDGKLLNCKFIGFDCLRMHKVALLKSKKKKILHIMSQYGTFNKLVWNVNLQAYHSQIPQAIQKYIQVVLHEHCEKMNILLGIYFHRFHVTSLSLTIVRVASHFTRFNSYKHLHVHHLAQIEKKE